MVNEEVRSNFARRYKSGPHGLGDPNDKSLRKVELDVLIPQKMRDKAKEEKCTNEVAEFSECCKNSSILMPFKCRGANKALISCLEVWYKNSDFKQQCVHEYLEERSEYRRTGIPKKKLKSNRITSAS